MTKPVIKAARGRAMTSPEQEQQRNQELIVVQCISALRLSRLAADHEDIAVALARLENWMTENEGRWTT